MGSIQKSKNKEIKLLIEDKSGEKDKNFLKRSTLSIKNFIRKQSMKILNMQSKSNINS